MTHVTFLFYFDACCLCYTQTPQLLWFPQPENIVLALKVNCMPPVCLKSALSAHPWCRSVVVFRLIVLSVSQLPYLIFPLSDVKIIYNVLKDHDPWKLINKWSRNQLWEHPRTGNIVQGWSTRLSYMWGSEFGPQHCGMVGGKGRKETMYFHSRHCLILSWEHWEGCIYRINFLLDAKTNAL